ncbi:MAG: HEAT repeat domain-containing protein [Nitrospirae bacterium]|nr:HEAT repeat domain-containing protein [Nitrospirota bacterium]MBI3350951.1 HEAT repeat domain-containing protein [Nitrospirota bacterium]
MSNEQDLIELKHPNIENRLRAIEHLGQEGAKGSLNQVIECLQSPEWRIRKEAVHGICQFPPDRDLFEPLIEALKKSTDPGEKNSLVEIFVEFGPKAVAPLMTHFQEMTPDVKKLCLDIFGDIGSRDASYLVIRCLKDENPNIQIAAIEALGKLKENRGVDDLVGFLSHEDHLLSFAAIKSLEQIGDTRSVEPLIRLLGKNFLERAALKALGQLGDISALNPIVNSLQGGSQKVKKSAIEALMDLQEQMVQQNEIKIIGRLREIYNKNIMLFLLEILKNPEEEAQVIRGTIRILGWMGELMSITALVPFMEGMHKEEAIQAIIRMKRGGVDTLVSLLPKVEGATREGVIKCLGEMGDRKAVNPLLKLATDPVGHVRQSLAVTLGKLGDVAATKVLIQLMDDPYQNVQEAAVQALRKFKDLGLISECIHLLNHEKINFRRNSIRLIGYFKAKEAVPQLALSLKDQDPVIRKETLLALKNMENLNIKEWVTYALADESPEVRLSALSCFEGHSEIQLAPFVDILKKDESIWVRSSLARLLGGAKVESALKVLVELLNDPVGLVQIGAIETMSHFHDPQLNLLLVEKLKSEDSEVQSAALAALGEMGDPSLGGLLEGFLGHESWNLRAAAVRSIGKIKYRSAFQRIEKMSMDDPDKLVRKSAQYAMEMILG